MTLEHFDAIEALLPPDLPVYRGTAPVLPAAEEYPYVVLGGTPGRGFTEGMGAKPDALALRIKITMAGLTFDAVLSVVTDVRAALSGTKLIVAGWETEPFEQETLIDITTDRKLTVPVIGLHPTFAVDEYTALSTR